MRRWTNEVIVGAAIVIAIVIGLYGYVFLRNVPVRHRGYHLNIIFENITGLENGDAVTVSGLKVGHVKQMRLENGHVAVRVWMNGETPFPRDSRAAIRSIGMIGEKYIDLMPGTSAESLREGDVVHGTYITDLADAGGSLSDLMSQATSLLNKLNTAMDTTLNRRAPQTFAATLDNVRRLTSRLDENLDKNMHHLENTLANLDTLSSGWDSFWQRRQASLDSASQNFSKSAAQLPKVVAQLDSALTVTRKLLAEVENQQGTVGKLLRDDEMYHKTRQTVDELQSLINDVKKNPGKYLQVSVIRLF
ncbi:MAG: MlaD family protein [candidate division KSB1 bacterium]|nr:MlaD family protein [candidate division KSB1 bacterium]MDZ7302341.1 MlaD family protein [candidate division KSB1 bacterium]MDZ7311194.1 MlaD family protein [candidate division KSB1 bacterium]